MGRVRDRGSGKIQRQYFHSFCISEPPRRVFARLLLENQGEDLTTCRGLRSSTLLDEPILALASTIETGKRCRCCVSKGRDLLRSAALHVALPRSCCPVSSSREVDSRSPRDMTASLSPSPDTSQGLSADASILSSHFITKMQRPDHSRDSSRISAYKAPPRSHLDNRNRQAGSWQERRNSPSSPFHSAAAGPSLTAGGPSFASSCSSPFPSHLQAAGPNSSASRGTAVNAQSLSRHSTQASSSSPLRNLSFSDSGRERMRQTVRGLSKASRAELVARSRREAFGPLSNTGGSSSIAAGRAGPTTTKREDPMEMDDRISGVSGATALAWDSDDSDAGLTDREKEEKENEVRSSF